MTEPTNPTVTRWYRWLVWLLSTGVIAVLRLYQVTVSPLLGPACRFTPSCSHYMIESIKKYGLLRGVGRGLRRLSHCHPWHPSGYDPP